MKANKALKRLAKIEALMSGVTKRYSAIAPNLRRVLQDALDAVARAKGAVSLQASSGTKAGTAKAHQAVKKATSSQKKVALKRVPAKARRAKTAKKSMPLQNAAKKRTEKKRASAPVMQAATEAAAQ
jgi:hypothetical protein